MNGTDINDTSLKTRYPKLSSDTDSTFLGGLVLEKSIVDPTYGFENCRNLSTFKMFLYRARGSKNAWNSTAAVPFTHTYK